MGLVVLGERGFGGGCIVGGGAGPSFVMIFGEHRAFEIEHAALAAYQVTAWSMASIALPWLASGSPFGFRCLLLLVAALGNLDDGGLWPVPAFCVLLRWCRCRCARKACRLLFLKAEKPIWSFVSRPLFFIAPYNRNAGRKAAGASLRR